MEENERDLTYHFGLGENFTKCLLGLLPFSSKQPSLIVVEIFHAKSTYLLCVRKMHLAINAYSYFFLHILAIRGAAKNQTIIKSRQIFT